MSPYVGVSAPRRSLETAGWPYYHLLGRDLGIWLAFLVTQGSIRRAYNLSHNVDRFCVGFVMRGIRYRSR